MQVKTIVRTVPFSGDPLVVFDRLSKHEGEAALFESPIGAGRRAERSFIFTKQALRLKAKDRTVRLSPLTHQGEIALDALKPKLAAIATVETAGAEVAATFPPRLQFGSDRDRIKAPSAADVLRLVSSGWQQLPGISSPIQLPGIFSYDFLEQIEALPPAKQDPIGFPDYIFWLPEIEVTINHKSGGAKVVHYLFSDNAAAVREAEALVIELAESVLPALASERMPAPPTADVPLQDDVSVDMDDAAYANVVEKTKTHIIAGDVFQIVPSRTFTTPCPDSTAAYNVLRTLNPSPYLFYIKGDDFTLFGASPEACVRVLGDPLKVEIHPIAGTRPRGKHADGTIDHDLDNRLEADLRLDKKELAEHMMLVDLARNDVARISKTGTRRVNHLSIVERYSHVMHLVSVIEGELEDELDALHAYLASMNMGTLVGAPKIEAAKLLRKYEADKRGPYGGAVGFVTSKGEMETAIIIRSAFVQDGVARIRAGAGIVYDSDPISEANETRAKAGAVLKAIRVARGGAR
jgi:anthranilate synthase component I